MMSILKIHNDVPRVSKNILHISSKIQLVHAKLQHFILSDSLDLALALESHNVGIESHC
jgi:hypothetical protein